jgi:hypothetical protein
MSGSKLALRSRVQWIRFVIEGKTSSNIYGCIAIFVWNVKRFLESTSLKRGSYPLGEKRGSTPKRKPLALRKRFSAGNSLTEIDALPTRA